MAKLRAALRWLTDPPSLAVGCLAATLVGAFTHANPYIVVPWAAGFVFFALLALRQRSRRDARVAARLESEDWPYMGIEAGIPGRFGITANIVVYIRKSDYPAVEEYLYAHSGTTKHPSVVFSEIIDRWGVPRATAEGESE